MFVGPNSAAIYIRYLLILTYVFFYILYVTNSFNQHNVLNFTDLQQFS